MRDSLRIERETHWSTAKAHDPLRRDEAPHKIIRPAPPQRDRTMRNILLLTLLRDRRVTRLWTTPFRISHRYPILVAAQLSRPHISQLTTIFSSSFTGT